MSYKSYMVRRRRLGWLRDALLVLFLIFSLLLLRFSASPRGNGEQRSLHSLTYTQSAAPVRLEKCDR